MTLQYFSISTILTFRVKTNSTLKGSRIAKRYSKLVKRKRGEGRELIAGCMKEEGSISSIKSLIMLLAVS